METYKNKSEEDENKGIKTNHKKTGHKETATKRQNGKMTDHNKTKRCMGDMWKLRMK